MKKSIHNTSKLFLGCLMAILTLISSGQLRGQLVQFNASALTGVSANIPVFMAATNLTSTPLTRVGVTAQTGTGSFTSSNWPAGNTAPGSGKYLTFTLTANPGYVINMNSSVITFTCKKNNSNGPVKMYIYSSVAGFSTSANALTTITPISQTSTIVNYTFALAGYNGLPSIQIRIYADNANNTGSLFSIMDPTAPNANIRITGGTVVSCAPVVSSVTSNSPICSGSTLNLSASASSPITPITYSWSGPNTFTSNSQNPSIVSASGAASGTYTVTATNSCGSTNGTTSATVTQVVLTPSSQTNITCNGASNGTASVNPASGGTGPYLYVWTPLNPPGNGSTAVTNLGPITYTCTATDANACDATQTFTITQPPVLNVTASSTNASCPNNDGTTTASPSGGTPSYSYLWSPGGSTVSHPTGLSAGSYTCTVTDANGCTAQGTTSLTSASCSGLTQLVQNYTNMQLGNLVNSLAITGASNYQYQFYIGTTLISTYTRGNGNTGCSLYLVSGLTYGNTYSVRVRAYVGSAWTAYGAYKTVAMQSTIPLTQLTPTYCNASNLNLGMSIYVNNVYGSTNYQYKFTDNSTAATFTFTRGSGSFYAPLVAITSLQYGHSYSVQVRSFVGSWSAFGPACNITMATSIPTTQVASPNCGATLAALSTVINCNTVVGATNYQWHVVNTSIGYDNVGTTGTGSEAWHLNLNPGTMVNKTYTVTIRAYVNGAWSAYGPACSVTTGPVAIDPNNSTEPAQARIANSDVAVENPELTLSVYPNPFADHITVATDASVLNISIYNSFGELVRIEKLDSGSAELNLSDLTPGIYLIEARTETGVATQRVVKQ